MCVASGNLQGDVEKVHFVAFNILLMRMASTTATPVGQLRTKSRTVHLLLRPKMARVDLRLELFKVLQPGGSGSSGGKSSAGKGDGKGSCKGKGGKGANKEDQNKKSDATGSKDYQKKNVKKVEADGGKEGSSDSKGSSGAGTGETSTLLTEVSSLIKK